MAIKRRPPTIRTDEDTVDLVRRLGVHYPDATTAGILNRQGRRSARGLSFTGGRVQGLRHHWGIQRFQRADPAEQPEAELLTVADATQALGLATSTLHRWVADGFIAGEQTTPGAPWRIRLTADIAGLFVDTAPAGWLATLEATLAHGVSRQTLMQRVKRSELQAVHVRAGRRKGLRFQPPVPQPGLFDTYNQRKEQCDDASKKARMSRSTIQLTFFVVIPAASASSAPWGPRPGRNP